MVGEILKEYLVSLGVTVDQPGFQELQNTLKQTSGTIDSVTSGWAKDFIIAGSLISTALIGVSTAVAGLMVSVAKEDLAMEKYARSMMLSKNSAMEMKKAIDALGESVQDIQLTPELMNNYRSLVSDGKQMKIGGDFSDTMKDFRSLIFEFTRLKQEASYAMQWVGYYLMKHLVNPLNAGKVSFKSFNDSIIKNMPVWTEKIARALVYIINIGKHYIDLLKNIGKAVYDVWDSFPQGIKIATAALAGFTLLLKATPFYRAIALLGTFLLLIDDYFGYMEGKDAAFGGVWDKLNNFIDASKQKLSEWGDELKPLWEDFVAYLLKAKDGIVDFAGKFSDWLGEIKSSDGLNTFMETIKRLGKALYELGSGIISSVVACVENLFTAFSKYKTDEKFSGLMERLWQIFLSLIDALSYCTETVADWLDEMAKSEALKELCDVTGELLTVVLDLFNAILDLVTTAFGEFFKGINKKEPVYHFRDAIGVVVDILSATIRNISKTITWLTTLFKMMKDNSALKKYWESLGRSVEVFKEIVFGALGAVGKLGLALMKLVRGQFGEARKAAGEAMDLLDRKGSKGKGRRGVAEAASCNSSKFSDNKEPTGRLSALGESGSFEGDPGVISTGVNDPGGISYGTYQFSSKWGVVESFINWLKAKEHKFGDQLSSSGSVNSEEFKSVWRSIASDSHDEFLDLQKQYTVLSHYNPAIEAIKIRSGVDINKMSKTLQEVLFSTAVHQGPGSNIKGDQGDGNGGAARVFERAFNELGVDVDELELIRRIYQLRQEYYPGNDGVKNRLNNRENLYAEEMLTKERDYSTERQNDSYVVQSDVEDSDLTGLNPELLKSFNTVAKVLNEQGYNLAVSSGWRSQENNDQVNGDPNSDHLTGEALDFVITNNYDPEEIKEILKQHAMKVIYHDAGSGIHFHIKRDSEMTQYAFENPSPENAPATTIWDKSKEEIKEDIKQGIDNFKDFIYGIYTETRENFASVDPLVLDGLRANSLPNYANNYNNASTTQYLKVDVGGVNISNSNASVGDVRQAVVDGVVAGLDRGAEYISLNRTLTGINA